MNPSIFAGGALLIASFLFVFWPESHSEAQPEKSHRDFLQERKDTIYENLRDLNFEFRAGKYPEEDYNAQRASLENEAAEVLAEIERDRVLVH